MTDGIMKNMTFIVYSQVSEEQLNHSLGIPDYSYYFVLRGFLTVLRELGQVIVVKHPEQEVDAIYDDCRKRAEECVFLTFSPPNKSATGLRCPTICVFAWEFDRIPDEVWDGDPKNDWRYVFSDHGRAITLSQYSVDAVKRAMGDDFPVVPIPVPVWDTFETYGDRHGLFPDIKTRMTIKGNIIDSHDYTITSDTIKLKEPVDNILFPKWTGEVLKMGFTNMDSFSAYLGGFYEPEPWGSWSRIEKPWVLLPCRLSGDVCLKIRARGYAANIGKEIFISIGNEKQNITLSSDFTETTARFHLRKTANMLKFSGLDLLTVLNAADPRTMGIGLSSVEISGTPDMELLSAADNLKDKTFNLSHDCIVYTSVFNPMDDRKNWIDMVKAFCATFQDMENATLVLKMTHHSVTSFLGKWHYLLQQLGYFKCRIVILHGYLTDTEYERLIAATHFYVNAARCEGLCLPLMEFMSCGKPTIAPCHTSLADYVDESTTLVVQSGVEPAIWPHDPRELFRALKYRIDWESLMNAYRQSYDIVKNKPDVYREMAGAARLKMKEYASVNVVKKQLKTFFCLK